MSEEDIIDQLQAELMSQQSKNMQLNNALQGAMTQGKDANLVELQLDFEALKNRIEHYLRGNVIKRDSEGNEHYGPPTKQVPRLDKAKRIQRYKSGPDKGKIIYDEIINDDLILLNEYGVNGIMHIIEPYLDKNVALSEFDEMRINEIMADLGDELSIFIFCNYERMGMTTEFKKSKYNILVLAILHSVEAVYRRALMGETAKRVNTTSIVSQSDILGGNRNMPQRSSKKSSIKSFLGI